MLWFCNRLVNKRGVQLKKFCSRRLINTIKNIKFKPKLNSIGAVIVEFAISAPILIILLFYVNDLYRLQRYYFQTEIVAQQIANMIQCASKETSPLTPTKLKYIFAAAHLTIYPGTTMFKTSSNNFVFGHYPETILYYVESTASNVASCKWRYNIYINTAQTPTNITISSKSSSDFSGSYVRYLTNTVQTSIHPSLNIRYNSNYPDENVRIIIETTLKNASSSKWKEITGIHFANPKVRSQNTSYAFQSQQILTPKPGAFLSTGLP